jgi:hypothetical protein
VRSSNSEGWLASWPGEARAGQAGADRSPDPTGHGGLPLRREYLKAFGPGVVAGAADTDPTTVATLVVIGATTVYGLAWLTLLLLPVLAVVETLATRVGLVGGRDLQRAVTDGYGRRWSGVLLVSIVDSGSGVGPPCLPAHVVGTTP